MGVGKRLASVLGNRPARIPAVDMDGPDRLAFKALLREPRLLHRLPRGQARSIADAATRYAGTLMRKETDAGQPEPLRDRAGHVLRFTRQYLAFDELCGTSVDAMLRSAACGDAPGLGHLLTSIARDTPEIADTAGGLAVAALAELSVDGTLQLAPDHRALLLLAATRHIAGFLRGERAMPHARPGTEEAAIISALGVVDLVHAAEGTLPLDPRPGRSDHDRAERAIGLWRDGAICAVHFKAEPTAPIWAHARDFHAFAAVEARPGILDALVPEEAARVAADAERAACCLLDATDDGAEDLAMVQLAARGVVRACQGYVAAPAGHVAAPGGPAVSGAASLSRVSLEAV